MGIAWTGEDEMETVVAAWEATAAFAADAQEAVVAALFSSLIEALFVGQTGANSTTRTRWAELLVDANGDPIAPIAAQAIMRLATEAKYIRGELNQVANGPTAQENEDCFEGDGYDITDLEAAH